MSGTVQAGTYNHAYIIRPSRSEYIKTQSVSNVLLMVFAPYMALPEAHQLLTFARPALISSRGRFSEPDLTSDLVRMQTRYRRRSQMGRRLLAADGAQQEQ
jgi:hypothetical protein